jgi:hypothetical protein
METSSILWIVASTLLAILAVSAMGLFGRNRMPVDGKVTPTPQALNSPSAGSFNSPLLARDFPFLACTR